MLLITRRAEEAIVINGSIIVKVLEIKGGRVKLGFEYPPGSSVFRQELFAKIQAENQAAAMSGAPNPALLSAAVNAVSKLAHNLHSGKQASGGRLPGPTPTQPEESVHDPIHPKPQRSTRGASKPSRRT